jgi:hypothetical protein
MCMKDSMCLELTVLHVLSYLLPILSDYDRSYCSKSSELFSYLVVWLVQNLCCPTHWTEFCVPWQTHVTKSVGIPGYPITRPPLIFSTTPVEQRGLERDWPEKKWKLFFSWLRDPFFYRCHTKTNTPSPQSALVHPSHLITPLRHLLRQFSSTTPRIAKIQNYRLLTVLRLVYKKWTNRFQNAHTRRSVEGDT